MTSGGHTSSHLEPTGIICMASVQALITSAMSKKLGHANEAANRGVVTVWCESGRRAASVRGVEGLATVEVGVSSVIGSADGGYAYEG